MYSRFDGTSPGFDDVVFFFNGASSVVREGFDSGKGDKPPNVVISTPFDSPSFWPSSSESGSSHKLFRFWPANTELDDFFMFVPNKLSP